MRTHLAIISLLTLISASAALQPGDKVQVTIRGIDPAEQQKINGEYRIGENGGVRLPLLAAPVPARGQQADQFARSAEKAYRDGGIYTQPAIEVEVLRGVDQDAIAVITVGGQVRGAKEIPHRKNMTLLQAIDGAGGRNEFGGRNVLLFREGKQYVLDFNNLAHKNTPLKPGDTLQVEPKGAIVDNWKGTEDKVRELFR